MRLKALSAQNFRNINQLTIDFDQEKRGLVLTGPNGSGKTNILEALVTALRGQPHRSFKSGDLIRHGETVATLGLRLVSNDGSEHFLGYQLSGKERLMKLDGAELPRRQTIIRTFPLVSFFPDELEAMRGEPALRRDILDKAFGIFDEYVKSWLTYHKLLKSRNTILRTGNNEALLMILSQQLSQAGEELQLLRQNYMQELNRHFIRAMEKLGFNQPVELLLKPGFHPGELAAQMVSNFDHERQMGRTMQGPHLADLLINIADRSSRPLASQGQQRLLFIGLKLAILSFYQEQLQETPIIILDDISSELGSNYIAAIYDAVPADSQLFISTINKLLLPFDLTSLQVREIG